MNSEDDTQKVNGRRIKFWKVIRTDHRQACRYASPPTSLTKPTNLPKSFKLDLILKISKDPQLSALQRILYADVDAMATVHLRSWMET